MTTSIAKHLLSIRAIFLRPEEPFIWASGIKSPIYCDNRLILSFPNVRIDVENALASTIKTHFPQCQMIMGTSTAGIAHAALVAERLNLPMGYVRGGAKDHGRKNQIEGYMPKNTKVVVIEDLISTGGSVLEVVNILKNNGAEVLGIASIFTYQMAKSEQAFIDANIKNYSLTNFDAVIEAAVEEEYIKISDVNKLKHFRDNPKDERWIHISE